MEPVSLCDRQPHRETTRCCHPPRKIREGIIPQLPANRPRRASSNETSLQKMHAEYKCNQCPPLVIGLQSDIISIW